MLRVNRGLRCLAAWRAGKTSALMSIEQSSLNSPLALDPERRDRLRRRRLTRNRLLASALLAAMATIYVATHAVAGPGSWILLLRAGAEAGVVGGLADWFAVTALFRHPLGLPIPHTAIIPNNKQRIGAALSQFVEQNFLTRVVLLRKLREAELGARLAAWLAAPQTVPLLATWVTNLVPQLIRALEIRNCMLCSIARWAISFGAWILRLLSSRSAHRDRYAQRRGGCAVRQPAGRRNRVAEEKRRTYSGAGRIPPAMVDSKTDQPAHR